MGSFTYTARNGSGQLVRGTVSAGDKSGASKTLVSQGLRPILIKAEMKSNSLDKISILSLGKKVKTKDLVIFTRQLSTMINAGVPMVRSLATLQAQTDNKYFKSRLAQVAKKVESGVSLGDALGDHPDVFSNVYVNMVRAGEAGGILDDILKKLALQQEKDAAIRAKVKSASTYPAVLFGITIIAFFALTMFVVPKIGAMIINLGGPDAVLPIQTKIMLAVSEFMRNQWYILLAVFIGGPIALARWRKTEKGRQKFDAFLLKVPIIKVIIAKVAIARFSRIFASLMAAGVTVLEAIDVTAKAIGNYVIEQELVNAAREVRAGKQLSEPLSESKLFPPIVSQMLAVGEETGQTDTILVKVADFYEEEVDSLVGSLSSIIEPLMIVVMGGMVGLIAASVIGPISSLTQNL